MSLFGHYISQQILQFPGLDLAYIYATSKDGAKPCFYFGDYDAQVANYQWKTRGTVTLGKAATVFLGQTPVPEFTSDVIVLNGDADNIFCSLDPVSALAGVRGQCNTGQFNEDLERAFSNARSFRAKNFENIGHCLMAHRAAEDSVKTALEMLALNGY